MVGVHSVMEDTQERQSRAPKGCHSLLIIFQIQLQLFELLPFLLLCKIYTAFEGMIYTFY